MPCLSKQPRAVPGATITDLLQLHAFKAVAKYEPRTTADLVAAVVESGRTSRSLRALGTNWSLSEVGKAQSVVSTDWLQLHLSQPFSQGAPPLPANRLRNGGSDYLNRVCSADRTAAGRSFVHVEAGLKLRRLLVDLKGCGLALPTMGAGAGQSLAGALSTSTHGADIEVPPLVEWIRAVHLVGAGGQEWWITPEVSIFANEEVLRTQDWCDDARIVANDQAFDAVRVSVGRMGVIYSMVLEVVQAYWLFEVNLEHAWTEIRRQLNDSVTGLKAGKTAGVFDAPLRDLESGWFRSELLGRTEETGGKFRYIGGPNRHVEPPPSPAKEQHYREMLQSLGLGGLAVSLRGWPARKLHHANIVVNLARPTQCWVTRRWRFPRSIRTLIPPKRRRDKIVRAAIENKVDPRKMVEPLREKLNEPPDNFWAALLQSVRLSIGHLIHDRRVRRFERFKAQDVPRIAARSETTFAVLFMVMYKLATDPILAEEARSNVIDTVSELLGGGFSNVVRAGLATDIIDTHDYELDGVLTGDSAEFFFDASSPDYLRFVDTVIDLANAHSPVIGLIGIRFTPRSTALIAMQRFPRTVSVEIQTGRSRQEDVYGNFWSALHEAAIKHRAIPHWGQEFRQPASAIASHYGDDLVTWRRMLAELSLDAPDTFRTQFSVDHGLEPGEATGIFDGDSVDQFVAAFEAAAGD